MNEDQQKVLQWLAGDDTGISSESLAFEFLKIEKKDKWGCRPPFDPADLGRCLRLIKLVPEIRKCVDSLAIKNDGWKKIAPHWDELSKSMEDEVGIDWSKGKRAPITYDLMQKYIYGA